MKYRVFNCTRQTLVVSELEVAKAAWSRIKGLIGRVCKDFGPGKGMWIVPSEGIHTFGMSFAIDVAYLDANQRVIRTYHRLAPRRIAAIQMRAQSVLELPAGVLEQSGTKAGDLLQFLAVEEQRGAICALGPTNGKGKESGR
jgi:uncharacterized protein